MLVLSRYVGERLVIEGPCTIEVVRIGPGVVRLGIEAAKDVQVIREELANGWKPHVRVRGRDVRVVGSLVSDPHIPVIHVAEASGDVGRVVREEEGD